jgi:hypothetical protein
MRKSSKKKLQLHRESLRGLDLQVSRGGVTQVDCSFRVTCTAAVNCVSGGVTDCTQVVTTCTG